MLEVNKGNFSGVEAVDSGNIPVPIVSDTSIANDEKNKELACNNENSPEANHSVAGGFKDMKYGLHEMKEAVRNSVQEKTHHSIMNHGTQIHFGLRALGNIYTIKSAEGKWAKEHIDSLKDAAEIAKQTAKTGAKSPLLKYAGMLSLGSEILGTLIPFKEESEELKNSYENMSNSEYIVKRITQSFDPINHITQFGGMVMLVNGFLLSGSGVHRGNVREIYRGAMTSAAAAAFTFTKNNEIGWQIGSGIMMARAPATFYDGYQSWKVGSANTPPGDPNKLIKGGINQLSNMFSLFYSGNHKDPITGEITSISNQRHKGSNEPVIINNDETPKEFSKKLEGNDKKLEGNDKPSFSEQVTSTSKIGEKQISTEITG